MNKLFKSALSISAAVMMTTVSLTPAVVNAWGDSDKGRPSYYLNEKGEIFSDAEFKNSFDFKDKIVFNSYATGTKIGDEKNFVGAKVANQVVDTWNADSIKVKDGETYTIRLYVHNNNPYKRQYVAEDVKARFELPYATQVAKSHTIIGYLNSSNASPKTYFDEVKLEADENVYIEYVHDSARYVNDGAFKNGIKLPNEVITSGALLGYDALDGKIPGCFEFDGVVMIDVKVHSSVASKVSKTVRIKGSADKTWKESVVAKVGDEVEYQIEYMNLLKNQVDNVMIRDVLPTNVEYVNDSTYFYNSNYTNGVLLADNTVTTTGINIGSYENKGKAFVRFTGKVVDNSMECGANQLVNWASATVNGEVSKDDASVLVDKVCSTPTPEPTPNELPNTGVSGIVTGALGAGSLITACGYYIASRKKF